MTKSIDSKLQTIIEYAIENGWRAKFNEDLLVFYPDGTLFERHLVDLPKEYSLFIFNHDFLKAVFGEGYIHPWENKGEAELRQEAKEMGVDFIEPLKNWQCHAQNMVISEDPVDYVYNWIKEQQ